MAAPAPHAPWPRAVIFDLDGTLVDSAPEIQVALNAAFEPLGVPAFDLAAIKTLIGGGAPAAVRRAAEMAGAPLSDTAEARVLARFYEVYAQSSAEGRGLYPGAHELLASLVADGVVLAICTNKAQPITDIAVKALGIDHYFKAVIGARDDLRKKPDPAPVRAALAGMDMAAVNTVMIGDTSADIGAAKAAGTASIAIAHGYAKVPPAELGADTVVAALGEVRAGLARLAEARSRAPAGT